jgi:hypothetical protein
LAYRTLIPTTAIGTYALRGVTGVPVVACSGVSGIKGDEVSTAADGIGAEEIAR